jgi:hypothetical protein
MKTQFHDFALGASRDLVLRAEILHFRRATCLHWRKATLPWHLFKLLWKTFCSNQSTSRTTTHVVKDKRMKIDRLILSPLSLLTGQKVTLLELSAYFNKRWLK